VAAQAPGPSPYDPITAFGSPFAIPIAAVSLRLAVAVPSLTRGDAGSFEIAVCAISARRIFHAEVNCAAGAAVRCATAEALRLRLRFAPL
jgi:hypothetical protein